jgi:hypothetical protein
VSLPELLDRLDTATGLPGGVNCRSVAFDRLQFRNPQAALHDRHHEDRVPVTPVDLNAAAAAVSGGPGSTYTDTTLTDNGQDWSGQNFAGRHVVAGLAGATVASNTAHTLTLQVPAGGTVAWAPTTPAAGSAYSISGAEGDVGIPQLGNALQSSGHGIINAVAAVSYAKTHPHPGVAQDFAPRWYRWTQYTLLAAVLIKYSWALIQAVRRRRPAGPFSPIVDFTVSAR